MKSRNRQGRSGKLVFTVQHLGVMLLTFAVIVGVIGYSNDHPEGFDLRTFLHEYYTNISTELVSIATAVLIIDALNRRRDEAQEERREREELSRKIGSKVNEVARQAAEDLRAKGWLLDGTLQESDLRAANLDEADLYMADLQGVNLQWASLIKASLKKSNFVGANLSNTKAWGSKCYKADMRGINFESAMLFRADLTGADLSEANFTRANLDGAIFKDANLKGANFTDAIFVDTVRPGDKSVTLPDGSFWEPGCDIGRFTNPDHPSF
ncbi:MAG: pentapeptide repeat-containing protein [Anaerolineae bacterium]